MSQEKKEKKLIVAKLNRLRIAPRKVRLVADSIRGKDIKQARATLQFTVKKAAQPLAKLLESAIANAKNNFKMTEDNLRIAKITVDQGRTLKRYRPVSRGRTAMIQKKTSQITLVLDSKE